jgi:hypothetical protein
LVDAAIGDRGLVERSLEKVVVRRGSLEVTYRDGHDSQNSFVIVPWSSLSQKVRREISIPDGTATDAARHIRPETRARLVEGIAKARAWVDDLVTGRVTNIAEIAKRERRSERSVRMILGLAFLSPTITQAAVGGSLPHGVGITELVSMPANWHLQLRNR